MTCTTTSGPYRCTVGDDGHAGPCECEAAPYRERARHTKDLGGPALDGSPDGTPLGDDVRAGSLPISANVDGSTSTPGGGSQEPGTITLEKRVRVLEEQVASLQLAMPRGIPQ